MPGLTGGQLKAAQRRTSTSKPVPKAEKSGVHADIKSHINGNDAKDLEAKKAKELERNIDTVIFGDVSFKAWYPSWYPKEIIGEVKEGPPGGIVVDELYVCARCFGYSKQLEEWVRHCRCCEKTVPGQMVYTHGAEGGRWSVWEVDGEVEGVCILPFFPLSHTEIENY